MIKDINKRILRLALPCILANLTIPLVGLTDLAISGHIGDAVMISGIAIGGMIFDLLYWNFGFLRLSTSGFAAQAYGRRDLQEAVKIFMEAAATALASATLILLLQFPVIYYIFHIVDASPEATAFAREYFFIRIWAAPAVMLLFVIRGWFIGMQNSISPMIIDIVVNGVHIIFSLTLAVTFNMGIKGIALGTVGAQYTGLITGIAILYLRYGKLRRHIRWSAVRLKRMKNFFMVSGDIIVRSFGMQIVYNGIIIFSSKYGEDLLAVNTILLKLMLIYSYFIDGFAYAGEALTGRYIGARDKERLKQAIKLLFTWSIGIGIVSTFIYAIGFNGFVWLIAPKAALIDFAQPYFWWAVAVPLVSCLAFMWDGIYIGATASVPLRNVMILSVVFFLSGYFLFHHYLGVHAIWLAYLLHLAVRTIGNQSLAQRSIYSKL